MAPQVLEHIVILCLERRYTKQNRVIRLVSKFITFVHRTGAETGGMQGMHPPQDPTRCWHDTWFHWKSSPKRFSYCSLFNC